MSMGGDGGGGEGKVLPVCGAEWDDGEVDDEGHLLVRRGSRPLGELQRRLEQAREALRERPRVPGRERGGEKKNREER